MKPWFTRVFTVMFTREDAGQRLLRECRSIANQVAARMHQAGFADYGYDEALYDCLIAGAKKGSR